MTKLINQSVKKCVVWSLLKTVINPPTGTSFAIITLFVIHCPPKFIHMDMFNYMKLFYCLLHVIIWHSIRQVLQDKTVLFGSFTIRLVAF